MTSYPIFNYRKWLIDICNSCQYSKDELAKFGMNIARFGELKDVFDLLEDGDEFELPFSLIEDSECLQIRDIIKVIHSLELFSRRLSNINALSENELSEAYEAANSSIYWPYSEEEPTATAEDSRIQACTFLFSIQLSLFYHAYMLSNSTSEVPDMDFDPFQEQPELLALLDLADQNVALTVELMREVREVFIDFEVDD